MTEELIGTALLLAILVTAFNRGFFSYPSFFLLTGLIFILFKLFFRITKIDLSRLTVILKFVLLTSFILFIYIPGGIYQTNFTALAIINILPLIFLPVLYILLFQKNREHLKKRLYILFILLAVVERILIIIASPEPVIDVFVILKEAPLKLLAGVNPYTAIYSGVYQGTVTDYYPYWPYTIFTMLPAVLLFRDPRILLLLADVIGGIVIYFWGSRNYQSILLSMIYLFRPNSIFIIEQSWLTPLLFMFSALIFWSLIKNRNILAGLLMGIVGGIQPLYLVLAPLTLRLWKNIGKTVRIFLLTLSLGVLPFFLWNKNAFIDKTIGVYFKPVSEIKTIPVHLSLNLNTLFYTISGKDISPVPALAILGILTAYLYKKSQKSQQKQILSVVIFFYLFYYLFRQSFINYYYYCASLLIFWLAGLLKAKR